MTLATSVPDWVEKLREAMQSLGRPPVGSEHPETSHDAAAEYSKYAEGGRMKALCFIAIRPSTADEFSKATGMKINTASPRFTELHQANLTRPTGERRLTRGISNTGADVYELTFKGRSFFPHGI